jgi:hypothetical protein
MGSLLQRLGLRKHERPDPVAIARTLHDATTLDQVRELFEAHGVAPHAYALDGSAPSHCVCVTRVEEGWRVWWEDGFEGACSESTFASEADACRDIVRRVFFAHDAWDRRPPKRLDEIRRAWEEQSATLPGP